MIGLHTGVAYVEEWSTAEFERSQGGKNPLTIREKIAGLENIAALALNFLRIRKKLEKNLQEIGIF